MENRFKKELDLHDMFVRMLYARIPKRAELVNVVAEILQIEKESAYRRLNGKVNFSVREIGILARTLNISLDPLLRHEESFLWLPFWLASPLQSQSMDELYDSMEAHIKYLVEITKKPVESGYIYNALPIEFYMHHPVLMKFMFFKWGYYFIGSQEFDNFSNWELPRRMDMLKDKVNRINFGKIFYICDNSTIWTLANEINNFHKMHVITTEEKEAIKSDLKDHLTKLELFIKGTFIPDISISAETEFYISSINVGFTCLYFMSDSVHSALLQTNFSQARIDGWKENCVRIREWVRSIRSMSALISGIGNIERRLFFENQHNIVDRVLG